MLANLATLVRNTFQLTARGLAVAVLFVAGLQALQAAQAEQATQATPAPALGLVTLLEGDAVLLRGNAKFALAEGLRLSRDDIIDMGSKGRFMLVEFNDGSSLAIGPATSFQIAPHLAADRGKMDARVYLLQGWVKVSAGKANSWGLNSSSFDLNGLSQDAVVFVQGGGGQVFAEAGRVSVKPVLSNGAASIKLSSGEFLTLGGAAKPELTERAPGGFLQSMPRAFQDKLPSRAALFQGKEIAAKRLGEITYSDAQAWLNAEPALRKANFGRWKPLAHQAEFRKGLVADIRLHPEWEPLLLPPQAASAPHTSPSIDVAAKKWTGDK
jgi:hypothetical protein